MSLFLHFLVFGIVISVALPRTFVYGIHTTQLEHDLVCIQDLPTEHVLSFLYLNNLSQPQKQSMPFQIHGWRWHRMAVLHELKHLLTMVRVQQNEQQQQQHQYNNHEYFTVSPFWNCTKDWIQHSIGFTMNGLHRVETQLFFPWLHAQLSQHFSNENLEIRNALKEILEKVESLQNQLEQQGQTLVRVFHL